MHRKNYQRNVKSLLVQKVQKSKKRCGHDSAKLMVSLSNRLARQVVVVVGVGAWLRAGGGLVGGAQGGVESEQLFFLFVFVCPST